MALDIKRTRDYLQDLDFKTLFNELGWSRPKNSRHITITIDNIIYLLREIAELSGVVVFEIVALDSKIPDEKMRKAIHKEISTLHHENLCWLLGTSVQKLASWTR